MKFVMFLFVTLLFTTACATRTSDDEPLSVTVSNATATAVDTPDLATVGFVVEDVAVNLPHPARWESYTTQYGIVLAEYLGSLATEGQLGGILVHIFVPPLDVRDLPVVQTNNRALYILREILTQPDYVGNATVSQPQPFVWDGLECAYYLMDNGEGNLTIVIGIYEETTHKFVTASISAPKAEEARIRQSLPKLLNDFAINGRVLSGISLDAVLPKPLVFPRHSH